MAELGFNVDTAGLITVDTTELKDIVDSVFKEAISDDIDLGSYTPQGRISLGFTAILENLQGKLAQLANMDNIFYARGSALDAKAASLGYYRRSPTYGTVSLTFSGSNGTVIPSGFVVSDGSVEYKTNNAVSITSGTAIVSATAMTYDDKEIAPQTVTTIVNPFTGIDSVTNSGYGTQGKLEESDESLRLRMGLTGYAGRTLALPASAVARISNLDNVKSVSFYENKTSTSVTYDSLTIPEHGIIICVDGGDTVDIAKQIAIAESQGCTYAGNTNISCTIDGFSYTYKIQRPSYVPLEVEISVNAETNLSSVSATTSVKKAIGEYFANNPFILNQNVTINDLIKAISNVTGITFASGSFSYGTESEVLSAKAKLNEVFSLDQDDITVEVV